MHKPCLFWEKGLSFLKKEELRLMTPIKVNGKEIQKLTYDTDKITAEMFCEAAVEAEKAAAGKGVGTVMEIDSILHLHLGFMAITAINREVDTSDLMRITGPDIVNIVRIGRNFITKSAAPSADENSGERSEVTAGSTTQE